MALAVRAFLQPEELPLKDFFDTWKFKILIGIAVFLVGIMAYAGANDRLTAAPQELLSVAVAPFQKAAAMVSSGVSSLWEKYTNIDNIIAAPEGIQYVQDHIDPSIAFKVVVCAVDEKLNEKAYIVPGLGDAGDRLYGVID